MSIHATMVRSLAFALACVFFVGTSAAADAGRPVADAPAQADEASKVDVNSIALLDVAGQIRHLGERDAARPLAIVFLSTECPIANQYTSELNRIYQSVRERVDFFGVIADPTLPRHQAAEHVKQFQIAFPVLCDSSCVLVGLLKPTHVPEAFVIRGGSQIAYRGRIDDQFAAIGKRQAEVKSHDLVDAIDAVLAGKSPAVAATEPVGCRCEPARGDQAVTYTRHVAPILFARCVTCHRQGEVAPFALLTYDEAAKRADFITDVTSSRRMPPWHARPGYGHFQGERRLTDREIEILAAWAKQDAPAGDRAELPPAPQFAEGWQLGTPDLVLKMTEPYTVPASGPDIFRYFVIPIGLPEDRIVTAVEFRPSNRRVAHHAIMYLDTSGMAREKDAADPAPGYEGGLLSGGFQPAGTLGFWAPGYTPRFLPNGVGQRLPKGSDLAMQMHYHPSGKEEADQSEIGVYFAKQPVNRFVSTFAMIYLDVNIMPGAKRHKMQMSFTTPVDLELLDVTPHMHLIGTEMKLAATTAEGATIPLVWSDWNFNWQEQYQYASTVHLPKGTKIDLEAYYDNSAENPFNPSSPPKRITLGEMTTDEMCICAFHVVDEPGSPNQAALGKAIGESFQEQLSNPRVMMSILSVLGKEGGKNPDAFKALIGRRFRRGMGPGRGKDKRDNQDQSEGVAEKLKEAAQADQPAAETPSEPGKGS